MIRFKNYNATGIAPDGRLYAGDLNLFQDLVAALTDLTQNHSVGTLSIGESGLQLTRYGAGELGISGAARVTGILRALAGFISGTYTTAARDGIAVGGAPYGVIILNSTTNRYEWNKGTDAARDWQPMGAVPPFGTTDISDNAITTAKIPDNNITTPKINAGAVTLAKIDPAVPLVPVGSVLDWPWAAGSIPAWCLLPYGQLLTQAAYPAMQTLADASARPYGGVAATNFNMPDYRGRAPVGKGDMGGVNANRITVAISGIDGATLGAVFGVEGITITTAQLPAHNHTFTSGTESADHTHGGTTAGRSAAHTHSVGGGGGGGYYGGFDSAVASRAYVGELPAETSDHTHGFTSGGRSAAHTHSGTTANTGSGSVVQNTQPSIIVNKIMRVL